MLLKIAVAFFISVLCYSSSAYADLPVSVAEGRVSLYDFQGDKLEFDRVVGGSLITVDKIHHEIHATYAIVFESLAASNYVSFDAEYYEHEAE